MVSTLPDGKCGIGTYTDYINNELTNKNIIVRLIPLELNCNSAIYYFKKAFESARRCNIVHVQFEYHLFGDKLKLTGIFSLLFYPLLKILSYFRGFSIVTTMHEIYEPSRIRDIIVDFTKKPHKKALYALFALFRHYIIIKTSDRIIVLSELNKNKLVQAGVNPGKIVHVPHGTDVPKFLEKDKCKHDLGIDSDKKVITIFGMISHHKGHDILVKAAQEFDNKVVFLIAGEAKSDHNRKYLYSIKKMASINTIFYGFVSQEKIPILFNATDIMVLPYRDISVSGVLELSMSYNIPTITSDLPYFKQINDKYDCILFFEKDNVISLKNKMKKLLENKNIQIGLINKTGEYSSHNNITSAVGKMIELYNELT